jgi:hypothetical protein
VSTAMSGNIGIAWASIIVAVCSWRHAVAPLAARMACPDAHLMLRCLAAPVTTLPIAVCKMIEYIYIQLLVRILTGTFVNVFWRVIFMFFV